MISVIVPVYNVEKYIEKSIESIINQSFKNFELILIDDGSTDNSIKIAKDYLEKSDVFWKVFSQVNNGQGSARNRGIQESSGEYIVFVDSDDLISPYFLEHLFHAIKYEKTNVAFCDFMYIKNQTIPNVLLENGKIVISSNKEILKEFLLRKFEIIIPAFIIKKNFLIQNKIFFENKVRYSEDQIFMWLCFLYEENVVYLNEKLYYYYRHEVSTMTSSSSSKIMSGYNGIKEMVKKFDFPSEIKEYILPRWVLGALYSCSKYMPYHQFREIYIGMNGKKLVREMKKYPDNKARIASIISVSSYLFYIVSKKLK
ncbi:MAG: glycosyltransferase family 2 protein [Bacilli bacterium]|uniref:glycosyltransferase family 2 protein n=1 Tax=Anaerorhabdus sp. TaxID=1872524 RepID=UPI002FCA69BE